MRSTAQVPPIENPTMPQWSLSWLTPNRAVMNGTTSPVRWSAALPRGPLTPSSVVLERTPVSTKTNTGALPRWVAAKRSIVLTASPCRIQSAGVLNWPP